MGRPLQFGAGRFEAMGSNRASAMAHGVLERFRRMSSTLLNSVKQTAPPRYSAYLESYPVGPLCATGLRW
jgi:hypothetical protein